MPTLTKQQKIDMYDAGDYVFDVPPVCTTQWNREDWIKYIDQGQGYWISAMSKKVSELNPYNIPMTETHYYKWLDTGNNYDHVHINCLRSYLPSIGFTIGVDSMNSRCVNSLRWIHDQYFHNNKKGSKS